MSSSGLVPGVPSKRVANEYGVFERIPLAVETVPLPSLSPPFQTALPLRSMRLLLRKMAVGYQLAAAGLDQTITWKRISLGVRAGTPVPPSAWSYLFMLY